MPKYPKRLSPSAKKEIIQRRGNKSDKTGKKHPTNRLEIHHKDGKPANNDPRNLRVLTKKEHDDLHARGRKASLPSGRRIRGPRAARR